MINVSNNTIDKKLLPFLEPFNIEKLKKPFIPLRKEPLESLSHKPTKSNVSLTSFIPSQTSLDTIIITFIHAIELLVSVEIEMSFVYKWLKP